MSKNNKILIILLIVLIVALFIINRVTDPREKRTTYFRVPLETLYSFEIATRNDTLTIVRTDTEWIIEEPFIFPSDNSRVIRFLEEVIPAETSTTPVSVSEESHGEYLVTDRDGALVSFFDAKNSLIDRAIIGRRGRMVYARRPDDTNVYQLIGNIGFLVTANVAPWRENAVLAVEQHRIREIDVQYELNSYSITATDTLWHYTDNDNSFPIKANNSALRRMFNQLELVSSMRFLDYEYEKYEDLFVNPALILTVTKVNNEVVELVFGFDIEQGDFVVMRDNDKEHMFLVNADVGDRFTISFQHFQS